ncbi:hypothetical protein PHYPSEUDO_011056 [Phytophthora pseudosyringae]|uniref:Uncharacterized protein n=1 Tax=Phytophthora pseudosyringae TaxID=221518 RepID=A0A8T1VE22_9STRA|nr:hypothetical protein PHYPSEUDO_011056 [Phytophthora pseudosyringae]
MDLSMILSPAVDGEETAVRDPPPHEGRESSREWSSDELQCAVAILQEFQQPPSATAKPPAASQDDAKQAWHCSTGLEPAYQQEADNIEVKPSILRLDDEVQAAAGHDDGKENNMRGAQQQNAVTGVWGGDDSMSKLDLLVQADAVIKRRRPNVSPPLAGDTPQHLRSGVWSRAEEEYAAALVSYFLQGLLDQPEGTTLRKFLAEQLCCNRRRVSMKLATESLAGQKIPRKVGASVFVAAQFPPTREDRQEVERVLENLRYANFSLGLERGRYQDGDAHRKPCHMDGDADEDHTLRLHYERKKRLAQNGLKPKRGKPTIIRTGFESAEEEEFVTTMFEFFMAGVLGLPEGTKLVSYLCQQLGCTPKHLSMKLAPRHMGDRRFPDNVGSITYMRKQAGDSGLKDDFSEEIFEVESRLTELRVAHEEAHKNSPPPVVTPVKRERTTSTASVSSTGTASVTSTPSASPVRSFRRSGPWSHDEEVYAAALIDCFFKGVLDIAEGTTLRAFLSSRLSCNPMRISKKLASECIAEIRIPKKLGSSTYVLRAEVTPEEQVDTEEALRSLQYTYLHSSSGRRGSVLGSKRPRSSRNRSRAAIAPLGMDSDATESDSDAHSVASSRAHGQSLEKLLKTEKAQSSAQEALGRRIQETLSSPEVAALKEQLA